MSNRTAVAEKLTGLPPGTLPVPHPDLPYAATIMVRDSCLCLHAQRAARALARRFDEVLRPLGLTNGQFSLLMALNRPEPATMGPVASLLAMDRTTLTAALKRSEEHTSELQSLMRISYAVFCLKKKKNKNPT